eukprot:gb/GFBE01039525.1/.p1 GENE.gb/GFBE01039525.1/~~gb/GFBE01039525.1/.p1  ORF type:complete len:241 (+),score=43.09 gb/GFBE01039525.1/:1-723(+)
MTCQDALMSGSHLLLSDRDGAACRPYAAAQLPLPNLLRPPPGLDILGPAGCRQSNGRVFSEKTWPFVPPKEANYKTNSLEECDACGSDCSTTDTSEVTGLPFDSSLYLPGQVLQNIATLPLPEVDEPKTCLLQLEKALPNQPCGTPECPSVGSAGHAFGICKPCDFMYRTNCRSGAACKFCHLCGPGETRRRKKQKKSLVRMLKTSEPQTAWRPTPSWPAAAPAGAAPSRSILVLDELVQ